ERVTAKIDRQRIIAEKAESAAREAMLERMHDAIETVDPTTPLEKAISPEAYAYARSHGDLAQLQARLDQRLKGEIVSDDPVLVNRLDNLAIDDPTAFLAEPIKSYGGKLTPSTRKRLLEMQADLRDPSKSDKARADWASEEDRINAGIRLLGFGAERGRPEVNEVERGRFRLFYRQALAAFIQTEGKKPTPIQADALLREVVTRVARNPGLLKGAA